MSIISSSTKYVRNSFRKKAGAANHAQNTTDYVTNADRDIISFCKSAYEENLPALDYAAADAAGEIAFDAVKKHGLSDELANEARFTAYYNSLHPFGAEVGPGRVWSTYLDYRSVFVKTGMEGVVPSLSTNFPGLNNMSRDETKLTYDGLTKLKEL
jgi:hypothetical protein